MHETDVMKANTLPLTPIENFKVVSIGEIPEIDIDKYELRIEGWVEKPLTLKYSDLLSRPSVKRNVMLKCVGGWSGIGEWTGIPLNELLNEVKIMRNARTVVFYSADGYSTSLSIKDLNGNVLLSYRLNGKTLPREHGYPLRLVVEGKYGYKWIKWITHIRIIRGSYKGYWERQGYSNSADINKPGKTKIYKLKRIYRKMKR